MQVKLRPVETGDLKAIADYDFTVSITTSMANVESLLANLKAERLWQQDAGARAIEVAGKLVGTCQFYRSAPCIHGYELGYIIHDPSDRGQGYASEALRQLTELLFSERPGCYRLQLIIEVWNTASWRIAERCGYIREGLLRSSGFGSGDPSDCFIYARTRKDWHEQQGASPSMGGERSAEKGRAEKC
ncbi:GNAT family N-acetyltransferase [Sphingosinicellaceae bacterium]|nr:GNAT family N-acetyltransferase [Sphingosinicellaceae bacterium]